MEKIQYYRKNVYGNETKYVIDENIRIAIMYLNGERTLSRHTEDGLKLLGFEFEEIMAPSIDKAVRQGV